MVDLSCGLEAKSVLWDAGQCRIPSPPPFRYITRSAPGPGCDPDSFTEQLDGCDCTGLCDTRHCACLQRFGQNYDEQTQCLLASHVNSSQLNPVFECNKQCKCDASCSNRLVQHGPKFRLKVQNADSRGFGLFTCEDVKQLEFVCEYAGEVVSVEEARRRLHDVNNDNNYLIVLREHCAAGVVLTCVDPRNMGNVGRFANHSCDPNMVMVPVRVDHSVPRLALFARQDILAGEELTFDYSGETLLCDSHKSMTRDKQIHSESDFKTPADQADGDTHRNIRNSTLTAPFANNLNTHDKSGESVQVSASCNDVDNGVSHQFVSDHRHDDCEDADKVVSDCELDTSFTTRIGRKRKWSVEEQKVVEELNTSYSDHTKAVSQDRQNTQKDLVHVVPSGHVVIHKKSCLCGSLNCKQYLPYDQLIFTQ